tara:strand:+ start:1842 stop:2084 length:243 start_codon:yes stop_codon:yes gene_type:complete
MNINQNQQQANINFDIRDATETKCEFCESIFYEQVWVLKHVSALISPNGQDMDIPVQLFRCADCKKVSKHIIERVIREQK